MRCSRIQELIKSDYLDGELRPEDTRHIQEHLSGCQECRRLEQALQAQRELFRKAERRQPPEEVWQRINAAIINERLNAEVGISRGIIERLRESLRPRQVSFALASAFTVVILIVFFTGIFLQKKQVLTKLDKPEPISADTLNGRNGDLLYDLGTNVEEYFL